MDENHSTSRTSMLAAPEVVQALEGPLAEARRQVETRLGGPITLVAEAAPPGSAPEVRTTA